MTATVRPARPDDAEALARLADNLNTEVGFPPHGFTPDVVRRDGFGLGRAFAAMVAEMQGDIVGYALYYPAYESGLGVRGTFLSDLHVVPKARRQGIARRLMAAVARETAAEGATYMWWVSTDDNAPALALYESLGVNQERMVECLLDPEAFAALADSGGDEP